MRRSLLAVFFLGLFGKYLIILGILISRYPCMGPAAMCIVLHDQRLLVFDKSTTIGTWRGDIVSCGKLRGWTNSLTGLDFRASAE